MKIIVTKDGSHTLQHPVLDETYHSIHGAIQESKHVFIEAGLKAIAQQKKQISLLEIGFGTGLNAWLTALTARELTCSVEYTTLETFPLAPEITNQLNFANSTMFKEHNILFAELHASEWEKLIPINSIFSLEKKQIKLEDYESEKQFDLIYFDAFSPQSQPELWTVEQFTKLYKSLNYSGILVTYCAKGAVKRNLKEAGFTIEALPGPPGKREMTRAVKKFH
ncbi:MAG: tRNA (5-methylaminomethyl-2-thiouridine)(34)-methyltransferase MnmD [Bacteroidetes bacterium]|nr:tRNA (5-methylaminomethyl-2-thiouridine)(34)-methyltransferase MnmD [Bacteroidota bacterium]